MNHSEGSFSGVRGLSVYHQAWLPEGEAKAVVLIVHGLGEHSGRYANVVDALVPLGYGVYALDHIGHGKSEGEREMVKRFEDYTDTLTTYLTMVKAEQAGKPIFLLGHSMGGLIASHYLLDHQDAFAGAVISAPAVKIGEGISQFTILMSKVLSAIAPKMGMVALDVGCPLARPRRGAGLPRRPAGLSRQDTGAAGGRDAEGHDARHGGDGHHPSAAAGRPGQ